MKRRVLVAAVLLSCNRPSVAPLTYGTVGAPLENARSVLVLLHGYGAPGDDLVNMGSTLLKLGAPAGMSIVVPEGPQTVASGNAWWTQEDQFPEAQKRVAALLKTVREKSHLSADRVAIGGFSQGAMLSLRVALEEPERPAAVLLFSGKLMEAPARLQPGLRVFMSHGRVDTLIPFSKAEQMENALKTAGHDVKMVAFDGAHEMPADVKQAAVEFLNTVLKP